MRPLPAAAPSANTPIQFSTPSRLVCAAVSRERERAPLAASKHLATRSQRQGSHLFIACAMRLGKCLRRRRVNSVPLADKGADLGGAISALRTRAAANDVARTLEPLLFVASVAARNGVSTAGGRRDKQFNRPPASARLAAIREHSASVSLLWPSGAQRDNQRRRLATLRPHIVAPSVGSGGRWPGELCALHRGALIGELRANSGATCRRRPLTLRAAPILFALRQNCKQKGARQLATQSIVSAAN